MNRYNISTDLHTTASPNIVCTHFPSFSPDEFFKFSNRDRYTIHTLRPKGQNSTSPHWKCLFYAFEIVVVDVVIEQGAIFGAGPLTLYVGDPQRNQFDSWWASWHGMGGYWLPQSLPFPWYILHPWNKGNGKTIFRIWTLQIDVNFNFDKYLRLLF